MDKASVGGLPLYRMMRYQLGWVVKDGLEIESQQERLLGTLCLEAALSLAPAAGAATAGLAAAAVEMFHQSVTVHEDMQMAEPRATDHPAVWWVWGPAQAINVGDGLYAVARLALFHLGDVGLSAEQVLAVVNELDTAALRYYEGQYLDLTYQERMDVTEAQYLKMAASKRGALFAAAMAVGARSVVASDQSVEALAAAGEKLGLAAQLREDLDMVWGDEQAVGGAGRVLNKSKLYPVVHALESSPVSRKRELGNIYFKRVMEPADLAELQRILDEAGVKAQTQAKAQGFADEALSLLHGASMDERALERWRTVAEALVGP